MQRELIETKYDMVGVDHILESVNENIIGPFQKTIISPNERQIPKSILITGKSGSGKTALASAIVNELRRGSSNKQADVHYSNRNVAFVQWNQEEILYSHTRTHANMNPLRVAISRFVEGREVHGVETIRTPSEYLRALFDFADKNPTGLTVILLEKFDHLCPSDDFVLNIVPRSAFPTIDNNKQAYLEEIGNVTRGKVVVIATTREPMTKLNAEVLKTFDYTFELPTMDITRSMLMIWNILDKLDADASEDVVRYGADPRWFSAFRARKVVFGCVAEAKVRARNGESPVVVCQIDFETVLGADNRRRVAPAAVWDDIEMPPPQRPRVQFVEVYEPQLFQNHVFQAVPGQGHLNEEAAAYEQLVERIQEAQRNINNLRRRDAVGDEVGDAHGNNSEEDEDEEGDDGVNEEEQEHDGHARLGNAEIADQDEGEAVDQDEDEVVDQDGNNIENEEEGDDEEFDEDDVEFVNQDENEVEDRNNDGWVNEDELE